jgi:hypothetical protein
MLDDEQRRVLRGMGLAMAITAAVLGLGGAVAWPVLPVLPGVADRIGFALRCDLLVVIWLVAAVAAVARGRFFSAADIGGAGFGSPGARIAVASAVLQNTLEQAALAVTVHLGLASVLRGREMVLVPLLVGLFCAGRLAFWIGYRHGAGGRALGFGLTFYPSVLGLGAALVLMAIRE